MLVLVSRPPLDSAVRLGAHVRKYVGVGLSISFGPPPCLRPFSSPPSPPAVVRVVFSSRSWKSNASYPSFSRHSFVVQSFLPRSLCRLQLQSVGALLLGDKVSFRSVASRVHSREVFSSILLFLLYRITTRRKVLLVQLCPPWLRLPPRFTSSYRSRRSIALSASIYGLSLIRPSQPSLASRPMTSSLCLSRLPCLRSSRLPSSLSSTTLSSLAVES